MKATESVDSEAEGKILSLINESFGVNHHAE